MIAPIVDELAGEYSGKIKCFKLLSPPTCDERARACFLFSLAALWGPSLRVSGRPPRARASTLRASRPSSPSSSSSGANSQQHPSNGHRPTKQQSKKPHTQTQNLAQNNHTPIRPPPPARPPARPPNSNTDESPGVATEFGIRSIPTIMIFKGGQKMETVIGAVPKSTLVQSIDKFL